LFPEKRVFFTILKHEIIVKKLDRSIEAFMHFGNKMDKMKTKYFYSSRTIRAFLSEIGKLAPDVSFANLECIRGKRIHLKFDEMSLAFVGKIFSPWTGIVGGTSPFTGDDIDGDAKQVLQFYATDVDNGRSYILPYFFISSLSAVEIELLVTRVAMACMHVAKVLSKIFLKLYLLVLNT